MVPGQVVLSGDELSGSQIWRDGVHRRLDEAEIGLAIGVERCWNADDEGVALGRAGEVVRGLEPAAAHRCDGAVGDVPDRAPAAVQLLDPLGQDVEADDAKSHFGDPHRQRNADISQPEDTDDCRTILGALCEIAHGASFVACPEGVKGPNAASLRFPHPLTSFAATLQTTWKALDGGDNRSISRKRR